MGKKINVDDGNVDREIIGEEGSGGSTATADSGDERPGYENEGGRAGDGTGNGTGEKTEEEKFPVLANLDKKPLTREERNARRREKYAEQKAKEGKKVSTRKQKKDTAPTNSAEIASLLIAVSSVIATRDNMSHWLLSEKEAKAVAEPLSRVIAKSETFKSFGEHSDAVALCVACATVFLPRIVMTIPVLKQKNGGKDGRKLDLVAKAEDEGNVAKSVSDSSAVDVTASDWIHQYGIKAD